MVGIRLMTIAMLGFRAMWVMHISGRAGSCYSDGPEGGPSSDRRCRWFWINENVHLRQFETLDLQTLPDDEAIITVGRFDEDFQFDYVLYDDLEDTRERGESFTEARFYAGRAGWQFGGKVVLRDREGRPWSIVIHRLGKPVQLVEGDAEILLPQTADKVPF